MRCGGGGGGGGGDLCSVPMSSKHRRQSLFQLAKSKRNLLVILLRPQNEINLQNILDLPLVMFKAHEPRKVYSCPGLLIRQFLGIFCRDWKRLIQGIIDKVIL